MLINPLLHTCRTMVFIARQEQPVTKKVKSQKYRIPRKIQNGKVPTKRLSKLTRTLFKKNHQKLKKNKI